MRYRKLPIVIFTLILMVNLNAQQLEKKATIQGQKYNYLLYLPKFYEDAEKPLPLIIFLHGSGERGNDFQLLRKHGPPKQLDDRSFFPYIVFSPQLPAKYDGWQIKHLSEMLDMLIRDYNVDTSKVFLTGLSMGGRGTWWWAAEEPERFAAIAPICGEGDPGTAGKIKEIPVWTFHGAKDEVVLMKHTQEMVDALTAVDADVRFTIYPTLGHVSWNEPYDTGLLYSWFDSLMED